jgi:hypothetical protein
VSTEEAVKEKKKGGKVILAICIVFIVILCVIIYLLLQKDDKEKRDVVVNEDNVEEILSEMGERVPAGSYQVTMNSTWFFENGAESSDNAYVENAEANTNPVYFDITRSDTEETIFESPVIPVGKHLDDITLDTELPAGQYDCVLTYHLLDDEEETMSTVRVSLNIVVQN